MLWRALLENKPFRINVLGWRFKISKIILPIYLNSVYGRTPPSQKTTLITFLKLSIVTFFGILFPLLLFLVSADTNGYKIKWTDNTHEGFVDFYFLEGIYLREIADLK